MRGLTINQAQDELPGLSWDKKRPLEEWQVNPPRVMKGERYGKVG